MLFDNQAIAVAKKSVKLIRKNTSVIDEGESAAILAWYTFILDHAQVMGYDPVELAREQMECFLQEAAPKFTYRTEH